jgi:ankyrin repeat protein
MSKVAIVCFVLFFLAHISSALNALEIHEAIAAGSWSEVKRLLDAGMNANAPHPINMQTPLMAAVLHGQTHIVDKLLDIDEVDVRAPEKDGYTPVCQIVRSVLFCPNHHGQCNRGNRSVCNEHSDSFPHK